MGCNSFSPKGILSSIIWIFIKYFPKLFPLQQSLHIIRKEAKREKNIKDNWASSTFKISRTIIVKNTILKASIKKAIILLNKTDLQEKITEENPEINEAKATVIKISALNNVGIDKLYEEITKMFDLNQINLDQEVVITNIRHKNLIDKAIESTKKAKETMEQQMPIDIIAIFIKDILEDLGNITGEIVTEDIIDEIFSKFCLGK